MKKITFTVMENEKEKEKIIVEYSATVQAETQEEALQIIYDELYLLGNFSTDDAEDEDSEEEKEDNEEEREEEEEDDKKEKRGRKASNAPIPEGYIDVSQVSERLGMSAVTISVNMGKGTFPKPDDKHGQKNIWLEETIDNYKLAKAGKKVPIPEPEKEEDPEPVYIDIDRVTFLTGLEEEIVDMLVENGKLPAPNEDGEWTEEEIQTYVERRNKKLK